MKNIPWSDEELGYLTDHIDEPAKVLAEVLGRSPASIMGQKHFIRKGHVRTASSPWSPDEDEVIRDHPKMTAKQLEKLLPGRTASAIGQHRWHIGARPEFKHHTEVDPYSVGCRTLVAKSCSKCGEIRPGSRFSWIKTERLWASVCKNCNSEAVYRRHQNGRPKLTKGALKRKNQTSKAWMIAAQKYTSERATNNRKEWTEKDYKVLVDHSLPIVVKAIKLGRSYAATSGALNKIGYRRPRGAGDEFDRWIIDNPTEARAPEITRLIDLGREAEKKTRTEEWDF